MLVVPGIAVLAVGASVTAIGFRSWRSSKRLALFGAAQLALGGSFVLWQTALGAVFLGLCSVLVLAVATTIKREIWSRVRSEMLLLAVFVLAIAASALLTEVPHQMQMVLLVVVAVLGSALIVALLVRAGGMLRIASRTR
jgi:hypothetical protein